MTYIVGMPKPKLTLYVDELLVKQMKIQALHEKRSVSEIASVLFREYLKRGKVKK